MRIQYTRKDRYGRIIGQVYLNHRNVNRELIKEGYAWAYRQYSRAPHLTKLEEAAKEKRLGLWANNTADPPWEYRKTKR